MSQTSGIVARELLAGVVADEDEVVAGFAAWLLEDGGAAPDDWHRFAMGANWDFAADIMPWIVRQPECDPATALTIFWKAQPDYYLDFERREDVPGFAVEGWDLVEAIRGRWWEGFYRRAELFFDLAEEFGPDYLPTLLRERGERLAEAIPADMRGPLAGRRLSLDGTLDGIPLRFWPEEA